MDGWTVEGNRWMNRWVDEQVSRWREERRMGEVKITNGEIFAWEDERTDSDEGTDG